MKRIQIRETKSYKGPDMKWTEEYTGEIVLEAGTELFHASDGEIKAFAPKTTCFARDMLQSGEIYRLVVKKAIVAQSFASSEIRIDLDRFQNSVEIYHIGELVETTSFVDEKQYGFQRSEIFQGREVYRKVEKVFYAN